MKKILFLAACLFMYTVYAMDKKNKNPDIEFRIGYDFLHNSSEEEKFKLKPYAADTSELPICKSPDCNRCGGKSKKQPANNGQYQSQ